MSKSKIEWTQHTWNPIAGCTKISAGCQNCYAENMAKRFGGKDGEMIRVGKKEAGYLIDGKEYREMPYANKN